VATYTNVSGVLECTGTDITSAGIAAAIDGDGALGTATYSTVGDRDVYHFEMTAGLRIGNIVSGPTASIYIADNEYVAIDSPLFHIYGKVAMGSLDGSSKSQNGGALAVTNPANETFRLYPSGEFKVYGSSIYASHRVRLGTDTVFWAIDCDMEYEDSVTCGEGSSYGKNQDVDFSGTRIHHSNAVGVKLYSNEALDSDVATFKLDKTKVESCTFAFQVARIDVVLTDVEIDSCTNHVVGFVGTDGEYTFINPDFTVVRFGGGIFGSLVINIEFRYQIKVTDPSGTPLQGVTLVAVDGNGDNRFDTVSDVSGNPTVFPEGSLQNATYAGVTRTDRSDHTVIVRYYGRTWTDLGRTATADNTGDSVPILDRVDVTQSSGTAAAHTGITITEEVSPVSWNGKNFSITVEGDTSVNPSLTLSDIYHYLQYHLSLSATIDGKAGVDWHDMLLPTESVYSQSGSRFYSGTAKGVRIVDQSANSFPGVIRHQSDDGTYYNVPTTDTFTINSSESGSLIQIFTAGTQTLLDSTTGSSLAYVHSNETVDYAIQKAGFLPQRITGKVLGGSETVTITLVSDPVYDSAHGLTYTTDASYNRATKKVTVSTTQDGDDIYSLFIDSFIAETPLRNTDFPIQMNGPRAAIFTGGAEFLDAASLNKWKRVGVRYVSSGGVVTAEYSAVFTLSSGIPAGAQAEYQQTAGTGTTDAINTGDIDELIQIYGDLTHGNFTKNTHLVVKYQENTYQESRVDVPDLYGITTLQSVAYPIPTPVNSIGIAAGDPVITGVTITNHGATPVSWDAGNGAKDYSLTITDTGANSGEDILRWLNYFMSLDATFQGEDPFNWPYMVEADGEKYRTERGIVEGSAGATLKGVRVINGSSDPHPDFSEFTADDGTLGIPPVVNSVSITNLPTDGANIMLQIYNITTATEVYAADPGGVGYSDTYTEGTDYTQGDEVRVRFAELNGATSFKRFETVVTAGSEGWSINAANFIEEDAVYAINAVDGSLVTKFIYTPINDQFNLSVAQNFVAAELFAYYCFVLTTAAGIDGAYGSFEAQDAGNYKNITEIANIFLDNETTASQRQTDSARIYKDDETYPVLDPTTSGFGIDINWQNVVYVVSTGGSSLSPSESAQLFATATQTNLDVVDANVDQLLLDTVQISTDIDGIPDAILNRNIATGSNGGRTVQDVMRANRNRVVIDPIGNTITVYEEDDITVAWSGAITTGDRDPINSVDPA
jgi:hypothetical protein